MALVRARDTQPELFLRKLVSSLGYRYRLHGKRLPGRPDMVFAAKRCVVFVHGCFWHQHDCGTYRLPHAHPWFWSMKLANNVLRDVEVHSALKQSGWRSMVVWECELRARPVDVMWRVIRFLQ